MDHDIQAHRLRHESSTFTEARTLDRNLFRLYGGRHYIYGRHANDNKYTVEMQRSLEAITV
jgi:hypothetical protein